VIDCCDIIAVRCFGLLRIIGRDLGRTTVSLYLLLVFRNQSASSLGIVQTAPTQNTSQHHRPRSLEGLLSYTMKRFTSIRKDKRKSADLRKSADIPKPAAMASPQESAAPSRQETMVSMTSIASDEAVPDTDPSTVRVACRWKA
jgi:hypothetical protein